MVGAPMIDTRVEDHFCFRVQGYKRRKMLKVLFFGIIRIIQGRKDLVQVRLRYRAILAVFQNGLSVRESDKVL